MTTTLVASTPTRSPIARRVACATVLTGAILTGTALGANAATLAVVPSPEVVAASVIEDAGGGLLNTIVAVIPLIIPVLLGLFVIKWAMKKFGLGRAARV